MYAHNWYGTQHVIIRPGEGNVPCFANNRRFHCFKWKVKSTAVATIKTVCILYDSHTTRIELDQFQSADGLEKKNKFESHGRTLKTQHNTPQH